MDSRHTEISGDVTLKATDVAMRFGRLRLFRHLSMELRPGSRMAITGRNGSGKSTLLKILAGKMNASRGNTSLPKGVRIGYLPQQMEIKDTRTLKEETILAFSEILDLEKNIANINIEVAERKDYESQEYLNLISKVSELNERFTTVYNVNGKKVLIRQIAGALARRIVNYLEEGQTVKQGEEMGFIKFGSRVDVFLPLDAKVKVTLNQKSQGNRTILAELCN